MFAAQARPPRSSRRRYPDMICWRVSAIYRCCIRYRKSKDWALEKLREISPEGHRDIMANIWWMDMADLQDRHGRLNITLADQHLLPLAA